MTDHPTGDFDDELSRRLADLDSEIAHARMPGATAARARAAQRTRHQVTTVALAGVAAIALGVVGITQPTFTTTPQPAQSDTITPIPTQPTAPTDTPSVPSDPESTDAPVESPSGGGSGDSRSVPPGALLTVEDVAMEDLPDVTEPVWGESAPSGQFHCTPDAASGAAEIHLANDMNGWLDQFIEVSETPAERFAELRDAVETCMDDAAAGDDRFTRVESWNLGGVGDDAWMAVYATPLDQPVNDAGAQYVNVRLMRTASYVSLVVDGAPGQDYNVAMSIDRSIDAANRLCGALEQDCVADPSQDRIYPPVVGDLAGWLTVDDITTAGIDGLSEGSEPLASDMGWNWAPVSLDPTAEGAESVLDRQYFDAFDPGGPMLFETIATFPSADAARAHYDDLMADVADYEEPDTTMEPLADVAGEGYTGSVWLQENTAPDFASQFLVGFVVSGATVAKVDAGFEVADPDLVAAVLDRAGERLGEL